MLAGKAVSIQDLKMIFGRRVFSSLNKKEVVLLMRWLKANQRTEFNFRPANPLIIELALQKLYAFWPALSIKLVNGKARTHSHGKVVFRFCIRYFFNYSDFLFNRMSNFPQMEYEKSNTERFSRT